MALSNSQEILSRPESTERHLYLVPPVPAQETLTTRILTYGEQIGAHVLCRLWQRRDARIQQLAKNGGSSGIRSYIQAGMQTLSKAGWVKRLPQEINSVLWAEL